MFNAIQTKLKLIASTQPLEKILFYGFISRLFGIIYSIIHDNNVQHIKYTDIDYQVFTNGSRAILAGKSPYVEDTQFRYSPLVALIFIPNILLNQHIGKLLLIIGDFICGQLLYMINIQQGTHRMKAKLFLILWLFNPLTFAISTRGSFEPIITLLVLATVHLLVTNNFILAGLLYGLSIHIKLYPIIYSLSLYIYMVNRKPYIKTQTKIAYWLKTLRPGGAQLKFFLGSLAALLASSYLSYKYYGYKYIEQSFIYHLKRQDLQHNFSIYFYLCKLYPNYGNLFSKLTLLIQAISVLSLTVLFSSFDPNRRIKLRKLTFSLFITTFAFVSLNKVCTSQYFNWYIIFLPLILDSLSKSNIGSMCKMATAWFATQGLWLLFAYLYEYQVYTNLLDYVGLSSFIFLFTNLYIILNLCLSFDVKSLN